MLSTFIIFGAAVLSIVDSELVGANDGRFDAEPSWSPECPSGAGKIPHMIPNPRNCRSLFICHRGKAHEYFCPEGKVLVPELQKCVKQKFCKKGSAKDWSAFGSCPEDGKTEHFFRHPVDCTMYYQCSNGFAYLFQCPSKTHFNTKTNRCDWPENVDCDSSNVANESIDLSGCRPSQLKVVPGIVGEITSPGYKEGQNYPNDLFCEYQIRAPDGFKIKLTFLDMDIEPGDLCMRDAVEIVDVSPRQRVLIGFFCGNETYPPIFSVYSTVSIIFRSDFMIRHRGFRINFVVVGFPMPCNLGQIPCRNRRCYNPSAKCDGKDDCGDGTDEEGCRFPLAAAECGVRKISGLSCFDRVIGGKEAVPGSWPWQADLQLGFIYPNGQICGGTLINPQWVVSAAHCFKQFRMPHIWRVHFGKHHKYKKDASEQVRNVERIILYPGTTGPDLLNLPQIDMMNDFALIKLNAPVDITSQVRPACLPNQGYEVPVGTKCMASGWGTTRGTGSNHALKEVELTIQPSSVCTGQMGPFRQDTLICVRNSKGFQDVCHGDSGGPLVCELNGKWHVVGATSYGTKVNFLEGLCAMTNSATVYSKVSHKTTWIKSMINRYG